MKDMGFEKVILKKTNVLSRWKEEEYYSPEVKTKFLDCLKVFGDENVMILSNMSHHRYKYSYYC